MPPEPGWHPVTSTAWSRSGKLTRTVPGSVRGRWPSAARCPNDEVMWFKEPVKAVLSSDGKWLFTCSSPRPVVALWDLTDGTGTKTFDAPAPGTLAGLALSPDGKLLAAGYNKNRILVWDVASRALQAQPPLGSRLDLRPRLQQHRPLSGLCWQFGSRCARGIPVPAADCRAFGDCHSVRFSPDEKLVALADGQAGLFRLWRLQRTGKSPH